jgi:uncharacterized protein YggE
MATKTITVKGIGKVNTRPDQTIVSLTLSAADPNYEETMRKASTQLDALRVALMDVQFDKDALKTANFNVEPEFENEKDRNGNYKRRFVGYRCQHELRLEFDFDMSRLSKVLGALSQCVAEPEFSVQFTVKDKDAISSELLKNAAENARKKAEILCAAAGVAFGELLTIDYNWGEINVYSPTQYEMSDRCLTAAAPCSIDIEPDDINASDTATFVWELRNHE